MSSCPFPYKGCKALYIKYFFVLLYYILSEFQIEITYIISLACSTWSIIPCSTYMVSVRILFGGVFILSLFCFSIQYFGGICIPLVLVGYEIIWKLRQLISNLHSWNCFLHTYSCTRQYMIGDELACLDNLIQLIRIDI